jgi:hypothetical protein
MAQHTVAQASFKKIYYVRKTIKSVFIRHQGLEYRSNAKLWFLISLSLFYLAEHN